MNKNVIKDRLVRLRQAMKQNNIDYYLMTTADFHCSEYVNDYFKCREYFSGFTGSNGNLLVTQSEAGLWTDGRYFVQAEKEIEGTGITLYRMLNEGVETIEEFLQNRVKKGEVIGFDGRCVDASYGIMLEKELKNKEVIWDYEISLADEIWKERPPMPCTPIWLLDENNCGYTVEEKMSLVRKKMFDEKADYLVLSKLDDLMWLLNMRGNDVECNPVALSYGIINQEEFVLFVQEEEITEKVSTFFLKKNIMWKPYQKFYSYLKTKDWDHKKVMIDPANSSYAIYKMVSHKTEVIKAVNPTLWYKAVKTEAELRQIRDIYLEDSAAVCKFIYWLKSNIGKMEMTEYSVAEKLDSLRAEIKDYIELSFPTISAYRENAAMMHYEATKDHYKKLDTVGMLLVDSGGQYKRGTTDITRTIVLGEISEEEKEHYSKTASGMLQLAAAKFLYGCAGRNLDILAREPLWEIGIDYKCGTGHGIGYILNVHEGPQGIRWKPLRADQETVLEAGMLMSDEPGVYKEGSHGIRIENILEVQKDVHNGDGQFMSFNMLTYVPLDLSALATKYLTEKDIERINLYHEQVYEKMKIYLSEEENKWLYDATRPLEK